MSIEELDTELLNLKPDVMLVAEINKLRQNSCLLLGDAKKRKTMLSVGISVDKFMPDHMEVAEKIKAAHRKTVSLTRNQTVDLGKLAIKNLERRLSKDQYKVAREMDRQNERASPKQIARRASK